MPDFKILWRKIKILQEKKNKVNNFYEILNIIDSFSFFGPKSTSITLSITGFGLNMVPITAAVGCGVAIPTKLSNTFLKEEENYYSDKYKL